MPFDLSAGTGPVYDRIRRHLREQIERETFGPGQFLPAEGALAERFGVSVGTIKKALAKLAEEGLVERTRGRGTQVLAPSANGPERKTVLVLLGEVKRSFFAEIYSGIQSELGAHGCSPILRDNSNSADVERKALAQYATSVSGAIIAPFSGTENYDAYGRFLAHGVPLVFVDRYLPPFNLDAAVSDNETGGYLAGRHLVQLGHRRIAVVGRLQAVSMRDRVKGFVRALEEAGLAFDEALVRTPDDGGYEAAYEETLGLCEEHPDVTAIFGMRDDAAWGCLQRLSDMGVRVPEDVSVVGFGDEEDFCVRVRPRLTTVHQDKVELGVEAARLLLKRMQSMSAAGHGRGNGAPQGAVQSILDPAPEIVSLPVELVVRESTAPPRGTESSVAPVQVAAGL